MRQLSNRFVHVFSVDLVNEDQIAAVEEIVKPLLHDANDSLITISNRNATNLNEPFNVLVQKIFNDASVKIVEPEKKEKGDKQLEYCMFTVLLL